MLESGAGFRLVSWLLGWLSPATRARLTGYFAAPRVRFIPVARGQYNNYLVRTMLDGTGGKHGCFLRVGVDNQGSVRIEDAFVQLRAIETRAGNEWHITKVNPANFHWANTQKAGPRDVPPKTDDLFCDIAHTVEGQTVLTLFLNEEFSKAGIPMRLQPGEYILRLGLYGRSTPEMVAGQNWYLWIRWDGNWEHVEAELSGDRSTFARDEVVYSTTSAMPWPEQAVAHAVPGVALPDGASQSQVAASASDPYAGLLRKHIKKTVIVEDSTIRGKNEFRIEDVSDWDFTLHKLSNNRNYTISLNQIERHQLVMGHLVLVLKQPWGDYQVAERMEGR